MQILKPLGNLKAERVKNWSEIKEQAEELREFMAAKKYDGNWRDAYAISHVQVSREPKDFFVLNKSMISTFSHWCIVNLEIRSKKDECTFPEACMSFMFRGEKTVRRYATIKVKYWTPFLNLFLIPHWKTFKAPMKKGDNGTIATFICQHEYDHSRGINIYGL